MEPRLFADHYELQRLIYHSPLGETWVALDRLTGQTLILKRIFTHDEPHVVATHDAENRRLAIAAELERATHVFHPHVTRITSYGFDEDHQPYLTMPLLSNPVSVIDAAQGNRTPFRHKLHWLQQLLSGLAYLHNRAILHGELKPSNALITEGKLTVIDYSLYFRHQQSAEVPGLLHYLAPEILQGAKASMVGDVYAVGMIAYELLTDIFPFTINNASDLPAIYRAIIEDDAHPTPLQTALRDLPAREAIAEAVLRCLAKNPADRPPSVTALYDELAAADDDIFPPIGAALPVAFYQPTTIARDTESHDLWQAVQALATHQQPQSSVWLISGETGVGKTHLLNDLRIQALALGLNVVSGRAVQGGHIPYQIWLNPLRQLVTSADLTDLELAILKPLIPDLEFLLNREIPDAPPLEGMYGRRRLYHTISSVFLRQQRTTLLLLEDLHWAEEGLKVLHFVTRTIERTPMMIVGTFDETRLEDLPPVLRQQTRLRLGRFNRHHIADFSARLLGDIGATDEMMYLLTLETEGLPLMLYTTLRALVEEAPRLDSITPLTLPVSVFEEGYDSLLRHRLARIPEAEFPLLQLAAIMGKTIDLRVLVHLAERFPPPTTIADLLGRWANEGFVTIEWGDWTFSHRRIRDTILKHIDPTHRERYYRFVAEAIEQAFPDERYAAHLMQLWERGGNRQRMVYYGEKAAQNARSVVNLEESIEIYEKLLASGAISPHKTALFLRKIGDSYIRLQKMDVALDYLQESLAFAEANDFKDVQAGCWAGLAEIAHLRKNLPAALEHLRRSLALNRETGEQRFIAKTLFEIGNILNEMALFADAQNHYQEALTIYEQLQNHAGIALTGDRLGHVALDLNDRVQALDYQHRTYEIYNFLGDRWGTARALNELGYTARLLMNHGQAATYYHGSLDIFRDLGDERGIISGLSGLGYALWLTGDEPRATRYFEENLVLCEQLDDRWGMATCFNGLGHTATTRGDTWAAGWYYYAALTEALEINMLPVALESIIGLAALRAYAGDHHTALTWLSMVIQHPNYTYDVRVISDHYRTILEGPLDEPARETAMEQGTLLNFEAVVGEILGAENREISPPTRF